LLEEEALAALTTTTVRPDSKIFAVSKTSFPRKPLFVADLKRHGWVHETGNHVVP
jgi:hypothetical protein